MKVNLNPTNSKVINGVLFVTALKVQAMSNKLVELVEYGNNIKGNVFVTALKCQAMSKVLADEIQFGNNITHPTLGIMYQYNGKFSRSNS